jgi:hypothetical protein
MSEMTESLTPPKRRYIRPPLGERGIMSANGKTIVQQFETEFQPHEKSPLIFLIDNITGAQYCECHIRASKLAVGSTIDAPLDPSQPGYKANRQLLTMQPEFIRMKEDALKRRTFSNIVAEYVPGTDLPLKIIGGQHRIEAIRHAVENHIDELQGVKVYFGLDMKQRLDVQEISNTNLDISGAWLDRLKETYRGSSLRDWCQEVGLLKEGQDFSDKTGRGKLSVHLARTFIANFYLGKLVDTKDFSQTETVPLLYKAGRDEKAWEEFLSDHPDVYKDKELKTAGKEFSRLVVAQRKAFAGKTGAADSTEKALNAAILSAWAYAAGLYQKNPKRLKLHYGIADVTAADPLNAKALAGGKHKTDATNYRGLGYRTDARERAQMVELFNILAEGDVKINAGNVKAAISLYFGKKNLLEGMAALKKA